MTEIQPTVDHCANEPIHAPGAIQPHGVLFVLEPGSFRILQISENTDRHLGIPPEQLLATPFLDLVVPSLREKTARFIEDAAHTYVNPFRIQIGTQEKPRYFDGIAHILPQIGTILELEAADAQQEKSVVGLDSYLHIIQRSLQLAAKVNTPDLVADIMAREVRSFTGFDRVMVYRLAEDFHGEVIAEDKIDSMEGYLGFHFPASDIPAQARELYLRNPVRLLMDANAQPVPVRSGQPGKPLDMSGAVLRAISPVHLEYLSNMGVVSSMSVSLVLDGKLWGLIACHHRTPRFVSYSIRATAALYAMVMVEQIRSKESALFTGKISEARRRALDILTRLPELADTFGSLESALPDLMQLFSAHGAMLLGQGQFAAVGSTPSKKIARALHEKLSPEGGTIITHQAPQQFPLLAEALPAAAGLVAIHLGEREWLIFCRNEFHHEVLWAGDPSLAKSSTEGKLHPRQSFKQWVETIRGRSEKWPENTASLTTEVRSGILEFTRKRNIVLERSNHDLQRFAGIIAHEVKNQLQSGVMALELLGQSLPDSFDEGLKQLAAHGSSSLSDLAKFTDEMLVFASEAELNSTDEEIDLASIVHEVITNLDTTGKTAGAELQVLPLPRIRAPRTQIHHVISNLVRNALLHARVGNSPIRIEVGSRRESAGNQIIFVRDNGRGVADEKKRRIFEYFYRDRPHSSKGTGIGLAFCAQVVRRMGHRIWVEDSPERGATFCFSVQSLD